MVLFALINSNVASLRKLHLGDNGITATAVRELQLERSDALVELDLSQNALSADVVLRLSEQLRCNRRLTSLNLARCGIRKNISIACCDCVPVNVRVRRLYAVPARGHAHTRYFFTDTFTAS